MKHALIILAVMALVFAAGCTGNNQNNNISDNTNIKITELNNLKVGNVTVTWLGHASFEVSDSKTVYIDPFVLQENSTKADYVLVTHDHFDHCDVNNIDSIRKDRTRIIGTLDCIQKAAGLTNSIKPGEFFQYMDGVRVDAVEAYNTNKFKSAGQLYHPKGAGVGFVLTIDGVKIYHAGDTDNITEMAELRNQSIDIALLPIDGITTMGMEEAAAAAIAINPKYVIPMHFNSDNYGLTGMTANPNELVKLLKDTNIKVVVLKPLVSKIA
ncbi:MBL fold metallo-hydrolase [archaeon]|nr:MBL fold metallo-hydrolase [archaeon]